MVTDVYLRLGYKEYKHLEEQLRNWETIETSHVSVDGYYHKALRLDIGSITLEVQGPAVKEPVRDDGRNQ
jgi:hypothetical protein